MPSRGTPARSTAPNYCLPAALCCGGHPLLSAHCPAPAKLPRDRLLLIPTCLLPCLQNRAAEAIACYEHVALLQPDSPEAHANLASAYKDAARQDTAIASYRRALQLRPDFPEAFANLVHSLQCVCEWQDRPQLFAR